jgi:hypothetical protein
MIASDKDEDRKVCSKFIGLATQSEKLAIPDDGYEYPDTYRSDMSIHHELILSKLLMGSIPDAVTANRFFREWFACV